MATVVREIERKYDGASGGTAALDAVKTMAGMAGVAAVPERPGGCRLAQHAAVPLPARPDGIDRGRGHLRRVFLTGLVAVLLASL
jgi:hypothetical protein